MPPLCRSAVGVAVGLIAGALVRDIEAQGMPRKVEAPTWLDDEGKDIFNDLEGEEAVYGPFACELREKLLKKMAGKDEGDAVRQRLHVLVGMGACEIQNQDYNLAVKRLDSAIGEMGLPNEDAVLQSPGVQHIALLKNSVKFLEKFEITQASTSFRRTREVIERNIKKYLKIAHKQLSAQQQGATLPIEAIYDEIPGLGKTGQYIPKLMPMLPGLKSEFALLDLVEKLLDDMDKKMAAVETSLKDKKIRLMSSSKTGSLLYVRALPTEAVVPAERSALAQDLQGLSSNFVNEASKLEKGVNLIKRGKEASGCKDGKLPKTCKALVKMSDVLTNGFGETRVVMVKPKSKTQLDACTTNANIGALLAAADGATLKVANKAEPVPLKKGEPVIVDFCREASLESSAAVPVLFAQAWHPEFAAVERTTELRARAKSFGLSDEEVKAVTKTVNDNAKKPWEKASALWRTDSEGHAAIRQAFESIANEKKKVQDEEEAKSLDDSADEEERKRAIEELEKKRAEKRKKEEEAEQARIRRKKQLEEERANRDPWLNAPAVAEAEKAVEELKEARREANAKLEFDLSTQLTKDISTAERVLKKEIKKARKEFKKTGKIPAASEATAGDEAASKGGENAAAEKKSLQDKLEDVKKRKAEAVDSENFKVAKQLKKEQEELESKLEKLEL